MHDQEEDFLPRKKLISNVRPEQSQQPVVLYTQRHRSRSHVDQPQQATIKHKRKTGGLLFQWDSKDDTSLQSGNRLIPSKGRADPVSQRIKSWREKKLSEMTERDWRIFRQDNKINIKGGKVPHPCRTWQQLKIPHRLKLNIIQSGFASPKPIQSQAISIGLHKMDMIALAPTGEGKTLAYLVPLINNILERRKAKQQGPFAMVMAPTRQLAQQIAEQFQKIAKGVQVHQETVVGGYEIEMQALSFTFGKQVLIGTPGRIRELLQKHYLTLDKCQWLVLDQADCMIDLGFQEDVAFIISKVAVPYEDEVKELNQAFRVTHMFSATMNQRIQRLARLYLRNFVHVSIGEQGCKESIKQLVELCQENQKRGRLWKMLQKFRGQIIIFLNQRTSCQNLSKYLQSQGYLISQYHGGKTQQARQAALQKFRLKKTNILVATDLGARGIHVDDVKLVVNYDAPKTMSQFIHRTGRTGRNGREGTAYTLLTEKDQKLTKQLGDYLRRIGQSCKQLQGRDVLKQGKSVVFAQ